LGTFKRHVEDRQRPVIGALRDFIPDGPGFHHANRRWREPAEWCSQ
jgi:hypothetical protein